ncbi:hypothetical protein FNF31_04566 [Cafeteria roenbergensis]|uniref:Vps72/YL1 N-terminal domain-containing protein n=1 Tax=Cafeteria roenbergensis TaxID=33653 RepID=A0A5A8D770_CAFRO|nr:hypothetical protein FNF31_04566 [Cafeteria roenbergensis]
MESPQSESSGSDDGSLDSGPPPPKLLPARKTRGTRVMKLVGEAEEADDDFWNQDAFREDEGDTDFSIKSEAATTESSDSDISDQEPTEEENVRRTASRSAAGAGAGGYEATAFDDKEKRKDGVYVDPALATGARARVSGFAAADRRSRQNRLATLLGADQAKAVLRSLTEADGRAAGSAGAGAAGEASRAHQEALAALRAKAAEAAGSRPSQEQVLLEAAATTLSNLADLEAILRAARQAEAAAAKAAKPGDAADSKRVRWRSSAKNGSLLTFVGADSVPATIRAEAPPEPERRPAGRTRYRDPVTGAVFDSQQALAAVRAAAGQPASRYEPDPVALAGNAARRAAQGSVAGRAGAEVCRRPVAPVLAQELLRFPL